MSHPAQQSASPSPVSPLPTRPRANLALVKAPRLVQLYQEGDDLLVEMSDGSRWQLIQSPGLRAPWEVADIRQIAPVMD